MVGWLTRRKQKQLQARGGVNTKPGFQLITYCPICNADVLAKKSKSSELVGVKVSAGTRKATCKNKHTWAVV